MAAPGRAVLLYVKRLSLHSLPLILYNALLDMALKVFRGNLFFMPRVKRIRIDDLSLNVGEAKVMFDAVLTFG